MLVWDEAKRKTNLQKHGLDFVDAGLVYDNPGKITFESPRRERPGSKILPWLRCVVKLLP
jgi:uncharacterized DUF497 family protein